MAKARSSARFALAHQPADSADPRPAEHQPTCSLSQFTRWGQRASPKFAGQKTGGAPSRTQRYDVFSYVQLVKSIKEVDPLAKIVIWGLDHESAYRQLPAPDPSHTWVVLPTPERNTLWRHTVLMFGSVASVWSYCRIADLMGWLCRACLFTPALHFVDDFGSAEDATSWRTPLSSPRDDFARPSVLLLSGPRSSRLPRRRPSKE